MPTPSKEFETFLNSYNPNSSREIRIKLGANHQFSADFDKDTDADKDWINHAVHLLVREYKFGNMDRHHHEAWYQSHIWSCFDKVKGVEAVVGGSSCRSSKKRKNQDQVITAISGMSRLAYGHKCDLIFREYDNGHNLPLEFGGSEAKPRIEEEHGARFLEEGFLKLPRMLKDMLEKIGHDERSVEVRC